ncbi:DUF1648 domain-containing protein [Sphaerimonospora mesophila]|uniref:DUF1648 domain-containing protein n=1 Tax=Sphaerimonospora mesophila TaxID=37483 RepID=UPI0006E304E7
MTDESTESAGSAASTDGKRLDVRPGLIGTAIALLASAGMSVWGWIHIPDDARIPTHWGASGEADGFSDKLPALIQAPLIMLAFSALFTLLPRLVSRERMGSARVYIVAWIGALLLISALHAVTILNAAGGQLPAVRVAMAGVGVLYLLLGNYLPKSRGGSAAGGGDRWAAQERKISRRTQRLGGRLLAGLGLFLVIFGFVLPIPALTVIMLVGTVAIGLTLALYSWWSFDPRQN